MLNLQMVFAFLVGLNLGLTFLNLPPALRFLMELYGVTYTGISVLMSALLWSHALMQVPAGLVADRLGVRRTLLLALIFLVCGNALPVLEPSLGLAIAGRVIAGIGTGLSFVGVMKLVAMHAPRGRAGAYQAFFAGLFSFGNIMAYYLVPKLTVISWRWVFLAPGLFSLLLLALWFRLPPGSQATALRRTVSLKHILSVRAGWMLGLYHALSWGTMINLGNWIPSLLAEVWTGSSAAQLAWGGMLVMLISGLGRMSGAFVLLRITPLALANGSILILAFIFLGLFGVNAPELLLPLSILAALFSSVNFGAIFHLASTVTDTGSLATLIGFINFLANVGAVLYTLLFGFVKDATGTFAWGYGLLTIISAAAFLVGSGLLRKDCSQDSCALQ